MALTVADLPAAGLTGRMRRSSQGPDTAPPGFAYAVLRAPGANQAKLVQPA